MPKKTIFIALILSLLLVSCKTLNQPEEPKIQKTVIPEEKKDETNEVKLPEEHLQKFDSGKSVHNLNDFLFSLGYDVGKKELFDTLTTWAITDIQLQLTPLNATGVYDEMTKKTLDSLKEETATITVGKKLIQPRNPNKLPKVTENPYDLLALINKEHALPNDYIPIDLTLPNVRFPFSESDPKKQLRKIAATALEELFKASDDDGLELFALSGYRSYERQKTIFNNNIARHGEEHANTYSARPGESEHQTGLVMDVTNQAVNFELVTEFGQTKEGIWLKDNAHNYGYIIRYPKDKVAITKYQYEPWHLRFVGVKLATELYENEITLDEYYKKQL